MVAVSVLAGVLVAGLALPFAGLLGLGARSAAAGLDKFPAELTKGPLSQTTRVLDANGQLLATFYDQDRTVVSLEDIAPVMQEAIIAIEDSRFYEHGALDIQGTVRAFIANQASDGVVQGGSSITQQLVKMTLLDQAQTAEDRAAATADTYERKLRELRYAVALEGKYSKDWILERYLNIAYFGGGAYGIESAAQHYFSTSAKDLKLHQAAMLAGLVKNPSAYDPTRFRAAAKDRRNLVLQRMAELDMIRKAKGKETRALPLLLRISNTSNSCVTTAAPFFCDYVRRYLAFEPALGATPKERTQLLDNGGLTITTTIDLRMQRAADRAVSAHVFPQDEAIGSVAMVVPGTGEVRALAQSRPMGRDEAAGETYLNYIVDRKYGDANGFQGGSTFKTFVLAAAIKQGIPLNTTMSVPGELEVQQEDYRTCKGAYPIERKYKVENASESGGTYTLASGAQNSVNTFFVQLEQRTGLCEPWKLARQMGLPLTAGTMVPSFTLGPLDVGPLQMAEAYATFAARGIHCEAHPVTQILDRNGKALELAQPGCERVLTQKVADGVNDVLRGVIEPGGFGAGLALEQPSAGKTGTTTDNKAVWFVGYTPNLATAAMVGGANIKGTLITLNKQTIGGTRIDTAFGSTVAGPIWADAMRQIQGMLPDRDFRPPDPEVLASQTMPIPPLAGVNLEHARKLLKDVGFKPVVSDTVDSWQPYGTVAYTEPGAFSLTPRGSTVLIYLSNQAKQSPTG